MTNPTVAELFHEHLFYRTLEPDKGYPIHTHKSTRPMRRREIEMDKHHLTQAAMANATTVDFGDWK